MSRIKQGKWGIYCASIIKKAPKEIHQPLIQILLMMENYPYDDAHHFRRLLEVNIERKDEDFIQACVNDAENTIKNFPKENADCVAIISTFETIVGLINLKRERIKIDDEEDEYKGNDYGL
jgi:hypothetical protein